MGQTDMLEQAAQSVRAEDLRFERPAFYIAASIVAWIAFWELADRNQQNPYSHVMAWLFVFVAVWLAYKF